MAVEDKYVNTNIANEKLANPALMGGAQVVAFVATFETAVADDDGSIYRIAKGLQPNLIPIQILIANDTITSSTDLDLGLYETDLGAVIDVDVFMDGQSMASARTWNTAISGLISVDPANLVKKLYEHAGETVVNHKAGYDLAFTANTVGSAIGTVTAVCIFIQG